VNTKAVFKIENRHSSEPCWIFDPGSVKKETSYDKFMRSNSNADTSRASKIGNGVWWLKCVCLRNSAIISDAVLYAIALQVNEFAVHVWFKAIARAGPFRYKNYAPLFFLSLID
jgi:hypothetical protein